MKQSSLSKIKMICSESKPYQLQTTEDGDQKQSIKLINRVMKTLLHENSIGRSGLSQATNIHYGRLLKQLSWLEAKRYVMFNIKAGKIIVQLTPEGRELASVLSMMDDD